MDYIRLKNSDMKVSRICLGGCPMGEYGWGKTNNRELLRAIDCAKDMGINFFDTADTYGLGKSEENYGKAIQGKRNQWIVATKFGVRVENGKTFYDNSPRWIEQALEGSLQRLRTDYIDLYQIHYRDGKTSIEDVIETLERLKNKGYLRYYGLSNLTKEDISDIQKGKGNFISIQNEYSLACRKYEKDILQFRDKMNVSPLTWGSLGQGILTGKYDETTVFETNDRRSRDIYVNFHGEKLKKNLEIVKVLKKIAQQREKTVASVAIRWILDYLEDSVVIAGVKTEQQVRSNVEAADWKLDIDEMRELEKIS